MKRTFLLLYFCTLLLFPIVASAASVSDEFTRANSLTLGANWDGSYGQPDCQIVSNRVQTQAAGDQCLETWSANTFTNDQWAQITIVDFSAADGVQTGILLRAATSPTNTWYRVSARHNLADTTKIFKVVAGVSTSLAVDNTVTWASGDILYVEVSGTNINVKRNGVLVVTVSDAALASGRIGLMMVEGATGGNTVIDSFSGGDLTGASTRRRVAAMSFE